MLLINGMPNSHRIKRGCSNKSSLSSIEKLARSGIFTGLFSLASVSEA
jgi:hypothetical protein